jgi:adenylate kinase family enzyme
MQIADNILRHYLRNCYFINGTAYAGKSTMCRLLAERYGMVHCEENYNMDTILSVVTQEEQPNLNYFNTKKSWQEYVSRSPEEFENWINGNSREVAGFEIAELIRLSGEKRVIVDTNISCDVLKRITDYKHVALLLSPQSMSVERFFDRPDPEKQFLLGEIQKCPDPEKTLENFLGGIARVNSRKYYDQFMESGFFTIVREDEEKDTREEILEVLARHFGLEEMDSK